MERSDRRNVSMVKIALQRLGCAGLIVAAITLVGTNAAWADAIDGTWCSERDHRQITINGSEAVLPGGRRVTGNYSRHRFSYLIPMPDAEAGQLKMLQLTGEVSMMSATANSDGSEPSEPERWKRCELTS